MTRHSYYAVFDLVARNKRILVAGPKGGGKSYLMEMIQKEFPNIVSRDVKPGERKYLLLDDFLFAYTPAARENVLKYAKEQALGYVIVKESEDMLPGNIPFDYIVGVQPIGNKGTYQHIYQYTIVDWSMVSNKEVECNDKRI